MDNSNNKTKMKLIDWILVGLLIIGICIWGTLQFDLLKNDWREYPESAKKGVADGLFPWIGAQEPELVVHEYFDYNCVHCPAHHRELRQVLVDHYDKVRLVRHDYPRMVCSVSGHSFTGCKLLVAALCAAEQTDFWVWNDAVTEAPPSQEDLKKDAYIKQIAATTSVDHGKLLECMARPEISQKAHDISSEAAKNKRVGGTPTYLIDGKKIEFNALIDKLEAL